MSKFHVVAVTVKCKGDSLWGKTTKGSLTPDTGEISYINWKPGKVSERLFVSLSLFGNGFVLAHYTDSGIPAGLLKSRLFRAQVRAETEAMLKRAGVENPVPAKMSLDWSEQGLQPEGGWNFDVTFA